MSFTPGQKVTVTFPADYAGATFFDLAGKSAVGTVTDDIDNICRIEFEDERWLWFGPIHKGRGITVEPAGAIAAQENQP